MTSIVAAILVALLVGPGMVNAAQCTANGRCFRGQFIVQFNYGSLAYINTNNIPYVPYQVSDMLINTERETPDQQFIQVGYTVGGCGHPTPEIIGEFYAGGTQYDTRCFGSAAGGYNASAW